MKKFIIRKLLEFLSKNERELVLTELVKKHFNTIGKEDILKRNGSSWSFEDRELDESEKDLIIAESKYILKTTTWKILEKEIMWRANKEMYLHSTDTLGLTMGKSWQYVFDVLKSKLKDIVG